MMMKSLQLQMMMRRPWLSAVLLLVCMMSGSGVWALSTVEKNTSPAGYRVKFGGEKPTFSDKLKHHQQLYGNAPVYPSIDVDWYFSDIPIGLSLGSALISDTGFAAKTQEPASGGGTFEDTDLDTRQKLTLTLIPIQISAITQLELHHYVVLDAWAGFEMLYIQETRSGGGSDFTQRDANSGTNQNTVMGLGLSIRLDPLEPRSLKSLSVFNVNAIYLMPFFEVVQGVDNKMGDFSRNVIGLMFHFKTS